jgi:hypothetical protein
LRIDIRRRGPCSRSAFTGSKLGFVELPYAPLPLL